MFSVVDLDGNKDCSATLKFRKVLTVESTRCLGYFSFENTDFKRQPRSQGLFPGLEGGTGKDPGIGWSRVHLTP